MTLGRKIVVLFLCLALAYIAGIYAVLRASIMPTFVDIELDYARDALRSVYFQLGDTLDDLSLLNLEYSAWDDMYAFAQAPNPAFVARNLKPEYWRSVDVDMFLVFDSNGQSVYSAAYLPTGKPVENLTDALSEPVTSSHPLLSHRVPTDSIKGVLRTELGALAVVSMPILTSDDNGPIVGSLIVGRLLSDARVAQLGDEASAAVRIHDLSAAKSADIGISNDVLRKLLANEAIAHTESTAASHRNFQLIRDITGEPAYLLEVMTTRQVSKAGASTINTTVAALGIASLLFLLTGWLFLQRNIVAPVRTLTQQILRIQRSGDLGIDVDTGRTDEVGTLAAEFGNLTAQLRGAQQELETARDRAVQLTKSKSDFLARMSHEIRTPMNGVLGMTELLQDTALDNRQYRFTQTIYDSASSLLQVINDILDFSKIEAGKLHIEAVETDLSELLDDIVASLAQQTYAKGIELIYVPPTGLRHLVHIDPVRLRQVLTNLLNNAIKFTSQGEVVLRAEVVCYENDHAKLAFSVRDTGIGISAENLENIFESFTQEDGSTTRVYGGTGLGLTIGRQLVELLGGKLSVESELGVGSTFGFQLRTKLGAETTVAGTVDYKYIAGQKILLVDENATNRHLLHTLLTAWRADVSDVRTPSEAFKLLDSACAAGDPFDLVIIDMTIENGDPLRFARGIRDNPGFDELKLMTSSPVCSPLPEDTGGDLRIAGQIVKPLRKMQVYQSVAAVLSGDPLARTWSNLQSVSIRALQGRVLLAEDNPVNQAVAIGMLESIGIKATVANDGREAVELAAAQQFDLILMDCQMPEMDGFQATSAIRSREIRSRKAPVPIVALTANALKGDRERCLEAGMTDYLTKPFTAQQLHTTLSPYLTPGADLRPCPGESAANDSDSSIPSALDRQVLDDLLALDAGGPESVFKLAVSAYVETSATLLRQLGHTIDTACPARIGEIVHSLKSSSANVGALRLADICRRMEIFAREDNLAGIMDLHDKLKREHRQVQQALKQELLAATA